MTALDACRPGSLAGNAHTRCLGQSGGCRDSPGAIDLDLIVRRMSQELPWHNRDVPSPQRFRQISEILDAWPTGAAEYARRYACGPLCQCVRERRLAYVHLCSLRLCSRIVCWEPRLDLWHAPKQANCQSARSARGNKGPSTIDGFRCDLALNDRSNVGNHHRLPRRTGV
jgi:hypothetical protein